MRVRCVLANVFRRALLGSIAVCFLDGCAQQRSDRPISPVTSVVSQDEALEQAKNVDLPALSMADRMVILSAPPPVGTGESVEITDANRISHLVNALKPSKAQPSGGETAVTVGFYHGSRLLREIWVFADGEWGFQRPGTSWTTGRSDELVRLILQTWNGGQANDIPAELMAALQRANHYELLSIDPNPAMKPMPDDFHHWRVLGRTTINDMATRTTLNDALRKGAQENAGTSAACFNPRHAIHVIHDGKTYDAVICFECLSVAVFENGQLSQGFLISESPQPVFDAALRAAGVPMAE